MQFLELGETDSGGTTWKFYGPDLNGVYGGMQGVDGLDAVVNGPRQSSPVVSDIRGNGYAIFNLTQGSLVWYSSRVTAYGAVEGYRPLPLADGANMGAASAWRGKWADITGLYCLGHRYYDPTAGNWLGADPLGHDADPSLYAFCAARDPVNGFDPEGMCLETGYNFSGGALKGFSQGFFGVDVSGPANSTEYYGQQFGRSGAGALATWLTVEGGANTGTGLGIMAASGTAEAASVGVATPVAGPAFAVGAVTAIEGAAQTGIGVFGLYNYNKLQPLQQPTAPESSPDTGSGNSDPGQTRLRDPETGRFVSDPNNPPSQYDFTNAQRRAAWKQLAQDPNSPLTPEQRAEVEARGWRGPQRLNINTGEAETMELSHKPTPLREGGTEVVPRWPDEHAAVDPHRQLPKP